MCWRKPLLSAVLLCLASGEGAAQRPLFYFEPLLWEASIESYGTWRRQDTGRSQDLETNWGVRFRTTGYSLDPRILRYFIDIQPVYTTGRLSDPRGAEDDISGFRGRYNLRLDALEGARTPVGFNAGASRNFGQIDRGFGGKYDFDLENFRLGGRWKNRAFPSTLTYDERRRDIAYTSGVAITGTETDDILRTLAFRGRSSKLDVHLETGALDDLRPQNNDYDRNLARLRHRFPWGKGSELTSLLNYRKRTGFLPDEERLWQQNARIQHTRNLFSNTGYTLQYTETGDTKVDLTEGRFALTHKLFQNLTTSGRLRAQRRDANVGTEDLSEGGLRVDYRKRFGWGGEVSTGLGGLYRLTDKKVDEGVQLVTTQDQFVVPPSLLVTLSQPFVVEDTIVVQNDDRSITYEEGKDYTLNPIGDFTQIIVIAESEGGRINIGQSIFVQYSYEIRTQKFTTEELAFNAALSYRWLTVFFRHFSSVPSLISGQGGDFLLTRRNTAGGLRAEWLGAKTKFRFSAERRFTVSNNLEQDSFNFIQGLTYQLARSTSLNLRVAESFSFSDDTASPNDLAQQLFTGDLSFDLRPLPRMNVRPRIGAWYRDDSRPEAFGGDTQNNFATAGIDFNWTFRRFDVTFRYFHNRWRGDTQDLDEDRLHLKLVRRSL